MEVRKVVAAWSGGSIVADTGFERRPPLLESRVHALPLRQGTLSGSLDTAAATRQVVLAHRMIWKLFVQVLAVEAADGAPASAGGGTARRRSCPRVMPGMRPIMSASESSGAW